MPDRIIRWMTGGRLVPGPKQVFVMVLGIYTTLRGAVLLQIDERPGQGFLLEVAPLHWWGWIWLVIGLYATGGAVTRHYTIPLLPIAALSTLWCVSYLVAWSRDEAALGWYSALGYLVQAVACLSIVRLIDPTEVKTLRGEDD